MTPTDHPIIATDILPFVRYLFPLFSILTNRVDGVTRVNGVVSRRYRE